MRTHIWPASALLAGSVPRESEADNWMALAVTVPWLVMVGGTSPLVKVEFVGPRLAKVAVLPFELKLTVLFGEVSCMSIVPAVIFCWTLTASVNVAPAPAPMSPSEASPRAPAMASLRVVISGNAPSSLRPVGGRRWRRYRQRRDCGEGRGRVVIRFVEIHHLHELRLTPSCQAPVRRDRDVASWTRTRC